MSSGFRFFCFALIATGAAFAQGSAPPNGFTAVAVSPTTGDTSTNYGSNTRLVLDANGDPAVAFLWQDPNGDGNFSDTALYFTSWNRTSVKFNAPVKVALTGDVGSQFSEQPVSLARDASKNVYGIAFRQDTASSSSIHLALSSDGGATWQDQVIVAKLAGSLHNPSLAMAGGNFYLAYVGDFDGIRYVTGKQGTPGSQLSPQLAPVQSGYTDYRNIVSLALDSTGAPALAYLLSADSGYDIHLVYWRPGSAAPVTITGSNGQGTDDPDIKLSFFGTQPRVAFAGALDTNYFADYDHTLWAIRSTDGVSWSAPVNIRSDNSTSLDPPISLALGSQGQGAIVLSSNGGGGDYLCSDPKISTSDSSFSKWSTCGPAPASSADFRGVTPSAQYGANDRLYIVFQNPYPQASVPFGVVLYAAPINGSSAPVVTSGGVVNGASFAAGAPVSPGELVTVFGSNFASASASASSTPLPTSLGGVSVSVNGEKAPLFFANSNQVNFQLPWDIPSGTANLSVTVSGVASNTTQFQVIAAAPGILLYNSNRAVATDALGSLIGTGFPAKGGSTIILYMTGSGPVSPAIATGAATSGDKLSYVQSSISAKVGDTPATVTFAGLAPFFVGLLQVNLVVPPTVKTGDSPLVVSINGVASNSALLSVTQ